LFRLQIWYASRPRESAYFIEQKGEQNENDLIEVLVYN
jgi:hypothetical protein